MCSSDLGESLLNFDAGQPYWRAFAVGLLNTLRVSMIGIMACTLLGTLVGLFTPQVPAAELLVALTLVVEGMAVVGRLPMALLVPCFALHGYVLSASVIGWESSCVAGYLLGLLLSQGALLLLSLRVLRHSAAMLAPNTRSLLVGGLMGIGAAFGWSLIVP